MTEDGRGGDGLGVRFELTIEDQLRFTRYQMDHSPTMRRSLRRFRWYPSVTLVVLGCLLLAMPEQPAVITGVGLGFVCFGVAMWLMAPWRWRKAVIKQTRSAIRDSPSMYLSERTVTIGADGIRQDSEIASTFSPWRTIERLEETSTDLMFVLDPLHAYVVPKSAFADPLAADDFADHARRLREEAVGLIEG